MKSKKRHFNSHSFFQKKLQIEQEKIIFIVSITWTLCIKFTLHQIYTKCASADSFDTLRVSLKLFFENDYICPKAVQGFRISFHSPDEIPRVTSDSVRIPIDQQLYISLNPKIVATAEALRSYSPENRGCFFQSDRKLRFFKTYNQRNCGFECLANYTKELCGCVAFWMPGNCETN